MARINAGSGSAARRRCTVRTEMASSVAIQPVGRPAANRTAAIRAIHDVVSPGQPAPARPIVAAAASASPNGCGSYGSGSDEPGCLENLLLFRAWHVPDSPRIAVHAPTRRAPMMSGTLFASWQRSTSTPCRMQLTDDVEERAANVADGSHRFEVSGLEACHQASTAVASPISSTWRVSSPASSREPMTSEMSHECRPHRHARRSKGQRDRQDASPLSCRRAATVGVRLRLPSKRRVTWKPSGS